MAIQKLILHPTFNALSREQIEEHLEVVRARRLVAAMEYAQHENEKLARHAVVIDRKVAQHYVMLGKEIASLDKAVDKVDRRIEQLEALRQESGLLVAQQLVVGDDTEQGDD